MRCEEHDWEIFEDDPMGCPVCYGAKEEKSRLINILETLMHDDTECDWGCENYGCGNGYYDALIERLKRGNNGNK